MKARDLLHKLLELTEEQLNQPVVFMSRTWKPGETTNAQFKGYGREERCLVEVDDVLKVTQPYANSNDEMMPPTALVQIWA